MKKHSIIGPLLLAFLSPFASMANPRDPLPFLSPIFGDHMVLQHNQQTPIWGWAQPGTLVQVTLGAASESTLANQDGKWQVFITTPGPGGPFSLKIQSPGQQEILHDILMGDVWLCGGQSNMELPLSRTSNGLEAIRNASHPNIRIFKIPSQPAYAPAKLVKGSWNVCTPETISADGGFSAVAYYFGQTIQSHTNIPIGLIEDCVGGTPAEAWTSPETLMKLGGFQQGLDEESRHLSHGDPEYGNYIMHWYDDYDPGQKGLSWANPGFSDEDWKPVPLPGGFEELGAGTNPAVCYFRKSIVLPDPVPPGDATLHLGIVERMDTTFINGKWVGASAWVENPRVYSVKHSILKPGTNLITVRVFKTKPEGGFESAPGILKLVLGNGDSIPLAGIWAGRMAVDARKPLPLPLTFENWPVMPGVLYNGMIAPILPFAIKGVIWYQGEANVGRAIQYRKLLPAMISNWRRDFDQGPFPFYIVSLAAFLPHRDQPGDDDWAALREAQAITSQSVSNSGLAITIDIGDAANIHAPDKMDVGNRLARWALARDYGISIPCCGPELQQAIFNHDGCKIIFSHADGGLVIKGGQAAEFSLAGQDHHWFWAKATVDGNAIWLHSSEVSHPLAARYAWQANPIATLYNKANLPAVPFRTDDWPVN